MTSADWALLTPAVVALLGAITAHIRISNAARKPPPK